MRLQMSSSLLGLVLLASPAFSQMQRAFPMEVAREDTSTNMVTVKPDLDAIADLMNTRSVTFNEVYLPGGEMIDLNLRQLDLGRYKYGFQVNGETRTDLLEGLDLSVWVGTVVGEPSSDVVLSFSTVGSRGWIKRDSGLVHLMPKPGEGNDWFDTTSLLITESSLIEINGPMDNFCESSRISEVSGEHTARQPGGQNDLSGEGFGTQMLGACSARECTVAVETDWQMYNDVFNNNLSAETAYITSLTAAASDRYESQFNTVLTFPYLQFYTTSNDGWSSQDSGGGSVDLLYEFQGAWSGNVPTGATLGHFLSGASLGGGVAWLSVLCNNEFNFGVSGNINSNVNFPVTQGPQNWDFMVFCHELGHNFSSPHSHDYCPPLDECSSGQCSSGNVCTNQGTIMSYCHLCPGGLANITTFFHPTVVAQVTPDVNNCLPLYAGVSGSATPPTIVSSQATTPVDCDLIGDVTGNVVLNYRYQGGSYSSVVMSNTGGNSYSGDLPVALCTDSPEFYISFDSASCGSSTLPENGSSSPWTASVGEATSVFADNFESNQGWSTSVSNASSGQWQRGVPVDDGGWDYDPASDGDGSGSAYLTQNENGNTDVDGGSVTLTSPSLDMTGGNVQVSYLYYLELTNADGTDRLLVEANNNGGAGGWTTIATHSSDNGSSWTSHTVDMESAGITLTNNMVVRFTANDGDPQSIVEAGVDGFTVSSVSCDSGPGEPTAYCEPANPNSFSPLGASLAHVSGTPGGVMTFDISDVPNTPGILFYGDSQADLPFGCGRRCVIGSVVRSNVYFPGGNSFQAVFDTTGATGSAFNIQYWFRDPSNILQCGFEFNTSNAIAY